MKNLSSIPLKRVQHPFAGWGDEGNGCFIFQHPATNAELKVIASSGEGWDHVSVSANNRCPNWIEMDYIKRLFFKPDECAIQYHVPEVEHINCHPFCLHLWRPQEGEIPMPPKEMVGFVNAFLRKGVIVMPKCWICGKDVKDKEVNGIYRNGLKLYCKKKDCQKRFIEDAGDPPDEPDEF